MSRRIAYALLLLCSASAQPEDDPMKSRDLAVLVLTTTSITGALNGQLYVGEVSTGGISTGETYFGSPHGTVAVGIAVSEGIALAADSRMTTNRRVISDFASKLFDVGNVGIATYGLAFLEGRNLSAWVADFRPKREQVDVMQTAREFSDFIAGPYDRQFPEDATRRLPLGFIIAGYDKNRVGQLLLVEFPGQREPKVRHTTQQAGATWGGNTDVITRLILGFDNRIATVPSIKSLPKEQLETFSGQLRALQYNIPFNVLTLQDGIDLALSLVRTTVEMQRFADGTFGQPGQVPNVGGAVDVLVITPSELKWIRRKQLRAE